MSDLSEYELQNEEMEQVTGGVPGLSGENAKGQTLQFVDRYDFVAGARYRVWEKIGGAYAESAQYSPCQVTRCFEKPSGCGEVRTIEIRPDAGGLYEIEVGRNSCRQRFTKI